MMDSLPDEYSEFWKLWENGEYFECHEVLEIAWRREENPERKTFFQGLIHCAVALVHVERCNEAGARGQLKKARNKLQSAQREYSLCEVQAILAFVETKLNAAFEPRFGVGNLL